MPKPSESEAKTLAGILLQLRVKVTPRPLTDAEWVRFKDVIRALRTSAKRPPKGKS